MHRSLCVICSVLVLFALSFFFAVNPVSVSAADKPAAKAATEKPVPAKPAEKSDAKPAAGAAQPVQKAGDKAAPMSYVDPQAKKILNDMGEFLKSASQYTLTAEISFDDVLPSGQKIQFSASEGLAVRKPSGVAIEYYGDLGGTRFWYNGQTATVYDGKDHVYATVKVPGNIDEAFDFMMKEYGFAPPLVDILYNDPLKALASRAQFGLNIGPSMVDGMRCHHLAFVEKYIDWQIWVEDGKQLVPRKIVITYKTMPGSPQFTAVLSDWDFGARLSDAHFSPTLPAGAVKIDFLAAAKSTEMKR